MIMKCEECGAECAWAWCQKPDEPCWGEVTIVEVLEAVDGSEIIHGCCGHENYWNGEYTSQVE